MVCQPREIEDHVEGRFEIGAGSFPNVFNRNCTSGWSLLLAKNGVEAQWVYFLSNSPIANLRPNVNFDASTISCS